MRWSKRSSGWCCGKCWRARRSGGHLHCSWCVVRQAHHEETGRAAITCLPHGELVEPRTTVLPPQIKTTPTYPRSPIRAYPSRVLSGGNASGNFRKSGKDRRFGFTGRKTCAAGEVWLNGCALGKNPQKSPGRVVPRIASIAYHIPKTRVPGTARLSHLSTARRNCGRGNGEERCRTILRGSTGSP